MLLPVTTTTEREPGTPGLPATARGSVLTRLQPAEADSEHAILVAGAVEAVTEEISALAALAAKARASEPPDTTLAERCGRLQARLAATSRCLQYEDDDTVTDIMRSTRSRLDLIHAGDIAEL